MHPEVTPIPIGRIIEKLDSYLNQNDYASAERHLRYWLSEAETCHDMRGKLTVLNEQRDSLWSDILVALFVLCFAGAQALWYV